MKNHRIFHPMMMSMLCIMACLFAFSCDFLMPKGEVYISADGTFGQYDVACSLYFVSYVEPGANAFSGRNIYAESTRTEQYGGRSWKVYSIPKGEWDVYFEYKANSSTNNARNRVNLETNDWAAIWVDDYDHLDTRCYQSSGGLSIPNL